MPPAVACRPSLTSVGVKAETLVAGVGRLDSTSSDELGLPESPSCGTGTAMITFAEGMMRTPVEDVNCLEQEEEVLENKGNGSAEMKIERVLTCQRQESKLGQQ